MNPTSYHPEALKEYPYPLFDIISKLRYIYRYASFNEMHCRCSVYFHAHVKLPALVIASHEEIQKIWSISQKKCIFMASLHDDCASDPSIGDIPLHTKLLASAQEKKIMEQTHDKVLRKLCAMYGYVSLGRYKYGDLLIEASEKKSVESQFVSYLDKIDGLCEAMHELLHHNNAFLEPVMNYLIHTFSEKYLYDAYPDLTQLFKRSRHPFFTIHKKVITYSATTENLTRNEIQKTGIEFYDTWREILDATRDGRKYLRGQSNW